MFHNMKKEDECAYICIYMYIEKSFNCKCKIWNFPIEQIKGKGFFEKNFIILHMIILSFIILIIIIS